MQPTSSQVYIDTVQSNIAVAYTQQQTDYIATQVFPVVTVKQQTGKYFVFDQNDFLRDTMRPRPPATESIGSGYRYGTEGYACEVFALHKDIDHQTRANSQEPGGPDRNATIWLTQMGLIKQEVQFTADFFVPGVWGTTVTGTTNFVKWSDYSSSEPLANIRTGIRYLKMTTGLRPNRLVLGFDVWNSLQDHPHLIDRLPVTTNRLFSTDALANLLGIDRVLVCEAIKATNNEGGTPTYDFIQGKHALLAYASDSPGLQNPSAGYTFMWNDVSQGLGLNIGVSKFYIPVIKSDRLEIEMAWDNKIVAPALGYFFENAA